MANNRVYYGILEVAFAKVGVIGNSAFIPVHGCQSVGRNLDLNITRIFELGQSAVYDNIEGVPDSAVTLEKNFDGYPPLWCLATNGASSASMLNRLNIPTTLGMSIFSDAQDSASGIPVSQLIASGAFINSYSISLPVDNSPFKESMGLICSNAIWSVGQGFLALSGLFNNTDLPFALTSGSGATQTREDFIWENIGGTAKETQQIFDVNGQVQAFYSVLPPDIAGIGVSGLNTKNADGSRSAHIQEITISPAITRESLFELGRRVPYFRYANTPIDVTTTIGVNCNNGDLFSVLDGGTQTGIYTGNNTVNRSIRIRLKEGTFIDLGTNNRLTSISQTGGDTGGGIVTLQYTYVTANQMTITHPQDPSALLWPF